MNPEKIIMSHTENNDHYKYQILKLGVAKIAVKCKECNKLIER